MNSNHKRAPWLWVWVGGAFVLMLLAWTVLLVVAHQNRVLEVPLITKPAR